MAPTRSTVLGSPSADSPRRRHDAGRTTRQAVLAVGDRAVDALAGGHRVGQRLLADGGDGDAGGLDLVGQLVGEVHVDLR